MGAQVEVAEPKVFAELKHPKVNSVVVEQ